MNRNSRVTVYAMNCTLIQYLLNKQDSLLSLLDTTEETPKTYANKGIGPYFFEHTVDDTAFHLEWGWGDGGGLHGRRNHHQHAWIFLDEAKLRD